MPKWIIDTDAGIDDAQALVMALSASGFDIVAITTVTGNTDEDHVFLNVSEILRIAERQDIPLYRGAKTPVIRPNVFASYFHGSDGLGEYWTRHDKPNNLPQNSESASLALTRLSKEHKDDISLICLGPLTNLAIALLSDPSIRFSQVVVMGGSSHYIGNITELAEFNFYADPEAAHIVLNRYPFLTLATWELTALPELRANIENVQPYYSDTPKGEFIKEITSWVLAKYNDTAFCDSVAMAIAINPEIITEYEDHHVEVSIADGPTKGMTIIHRNRFNTHESKPKNVRVVNKIDPDRFWQMIYASTK